MSTRKRTQTKPWQNHKVIKLHELHESKEGTSEGRERQLARPKVALSPDTTHSPWHLPHIFPRGWPKPTGASTNELGRSRTSHLKASQGTPQITTGLTKERKHGWMMLNDAECSELKKWPLPHDLLLKVRKGLLDLASWNLAKTYRSQHDAEVLLETPNCPRLKKTAWDRFCHQMYAWQSSSFSTKRWDWSWMMCLSDLEWCEVTFVFVTLLFSNTPQAEQGSSQREGCPVRES